MNGGLNLKLENSCCVSMCVSGTPASDTVCKRCPAGHFSSSDSSAEPCQPHRNCSHLGLKTLRWGSATSDSLCASQDKTAALDCSQHQALCRNGKRPDRKSSGGAQTRLGAQTPEGSDPGRARGDHIWGAQIPGWGLRPQRAQTPGGRGDSDPRRVRTGGAQTSGGTDPGWGLRPRLRAQTQGTQMWGAQTSAGLDPGCGLKPPRARNWGGSESGGLRPKGAQTPLEVLTGGYGGFRPWGGGFRRRLGAQTPEGSELGGSELGGAQTPGRSDQGSDPRGLMSRAHVTMFSAKNRVDRRETGNETESLRTSYGCVLGISSVRRRQDSTLVQILV